MVLKFTMYVVLARTTQTLGSVSVVYLCCASSRVDSYIYQDQSVGDLNSGKDSSSERRIHNIPFQRLMTLIRAPGVHAHPLATF
jgi:hypothetical protein